MQVNATGRQAITVKFRPATITKGSRLTAACAAGKVTVARNWACSVSEEYALAARALIEKLGWDGEWVGGSTAANTYVFVQVI